MPANCADVRRHDPVPCCLQTAVCCQLAALICLGCRHQQLHGAVRCCSVINQLHRCGRGDCSANPPRSWTTALGLTARMAPWQVETVRLEVHGATACAAPCAAGQRAYEAGCPCVATSPGHLCHMSSWKQTCARWPRGPVERPSTTKRSHCAASRPGHTVCASSSP